MAQVTTRRTTIRAKRSAPVVDWFTQWFEVKDEAEQLVERQGDLRVRLLDAVEEYGDVDENGSFWFDLPEVVTVKDHKGKIFKFSSLKKERHLRPANPTPDPELAEGLLRKKGLYLSAKQEKAIRDLKIACPYVNISVDVDPDAVANLLFKDLITEKEYEATLQEQKESFQFRPSES